MTLPPASSEAQSHAYYGLTPPPLTSWRARLFEAMTSVHSPRNRRIREHTPYSPTLTAERVAEIGQWIAWGLDHAQAELGPPAYAGSLQALGQWVARSVRSRFIDPGILVYLTFSSDIDHPIFVGGFTAESRTINFDATLFSWINNSLDTGRMLSKRGLWYSMPALVAAFAAPLEEYHHLHFYRLGLVKALFRAMPYEYRPQEQVANVFCEANLTELSMPMFGPVDPEFKEKFPVYTFDLEQDTPPSRQSVWEQEFLARIVQMHPDDQSWATMARMVLRQYQRATNYIGEAYAVSAKKGFPVVTDAVEGTLAYDRESGQIVLPLAYLEKLYRTLEDRPLLSELSGYGVKLNTPQSVVLMDLVSAYFDRFQWQGLCHGKSHHYRPEEFGRPEGRPAQDMKTMQDQASQHLHLHLEGTWRGRLENGLHDLKQRLSSFLPHR